MKRNFAIVVLMALTVLIGLGVARRDQLRSELDDAPSVFEHSLAVDVVLRRDASRRGFGCIRAAPPDTTVRAVMNRIDSAVFEWKYGPSPAIVRK